MMKTKNIFAVSFIAMLAVSAAGAKVVTQSNIVGGNGIDVSVPASGTNAGKVEIKSAVAYGVGAGGATATTKTVSIPGIKKLETGLVIVVKPANTSTVADSKLQLNDFEAKNMMYNNAAITTSTDSVVWNSAYPSVFVFDGTNWVFLGHGVDSNTTYSGMSVDEINAGTGTGNRLISSANLKTAIEKWAPETDISGKADKATNLTGATKTKITYNDQGIVTAGADLAASDLPSHNHASSDVNAMTGYVKADSAAAIATTDTLNQAIGKLEKGLDAKANSGDLATVATSGSYNDLSNKPTIPTVNNKTITIQRNGTTVDSFTTNNSANKTINITVGKGDVGLGNVDNTSDADKPVSTATQTALNGKQDKLDATASTGNIKGTNGVTVQTPTTGDDAGKVVISGPGTINNATLTIQQNGTTVKTFTANASSNVTANITVPTQPSDIGAAAASHNHNTGEVTALTGYSKGSVSSALAAGDTLNAALGKLENKADNAATAASTAEQNAKDYADGLAGNYAAATNKVNGAPLSNTETYFYGASTTAAATAQKDVSIPSITELKAGQIIVVTPTITSTVANSTIKLNSFNAYPMKYRNGAITTSTDSIVWYANTPSVFVFDGSAWNFAGGGTDNTTYSAMSVSEGTTGSATSGRSMRADYLKQIIQGTNTGNEPVNGLAANAYLTGYAKASESAAVATTDTIKVAIGKLEKGLDAKANSGDLATVATSGSYNDLSNKPTIPTVNNATLTIQQNGTTVKTFTANASSNVTANITVPTQPSDIGAAAASHNHNTGEVTVATDYAQPSTASAVAEGDTVTAAIGKLEKQIAGKQASGSYATATQGGKADTAIQSVKVNGTALTPDANKAVNVPAAASNTFGVVKTGNNITNSSGTISVATANGSTLGVVKAGTNVSISSGSVSVADAGASTKGVAQLAADGVNTTAVNTTAENVSNKITSTSGYNTYLTNAAAYPNMPVVNQMIANSNITTNAAIAKKIDTTVAADNNSVMVRDSGGNYVKGLGTDVGVANDGTITVNHATSANSIPSGSENATTYASIWVE